MKRIIILVVLICSFYFTKSTLIARENTTENTVKIEQVKKPQKKNCCNDVKVGQKCPVCGKVKKACCTKCKEDCCKKEAKCCKKVKVGEKCPKCGKVKKACCKKHTIEKTGDSCPIYYEDKEGCCKKKDKTPPPPPNKKPVKKNQ